MDKVKLGGHIPLHGPLTFLPLIAKAIGYNAIQTSITGEGWYPIDVEEKTTRNFHVMMAGVDLYVHMPYTINMCEERGRRRSFYKAVYKKYARVSASLGAKALVIHLGYKKTLTEEMAIQNVVGFLDEVLEEEFPRCLLEIDAGSKNRSAVGSPEVIEEVLQRSKGNVGMCLDTCHMYARGVDLWDEEIRGVTFSKYGKYLRLVHLNVPDPEVTLGSNRDRHNTEFKDFPKDSEGLIKECMKWPCILERRSLSVQEKDYEYIKGLFKDFLDLGIKGVEVENGSDTGRVQGED